MLPNRSIARARHVREHPIEQQRLERALLCTFGDGLLEQSEWEVFSVAGRKRHCGRMCLADPPGHHLCHPADIDVSGE